MTVPVGLQTSYLCVFTLFSAAFDTGVAIYNRYFADEENNIGYAAHFGGALCGELLFLC